MYYLLLLPVAWDINNALYSALSEGKIFASCFWYESTNPMKISNPVSRES